MDNSIKKLFTILFLIFIAFSSFSRDGGIGKLLTLSGEKLNGEVYLEEKLRLELPWEDSTGLRVYINNIPMDTLARMRGESNNYFFTLRNITLGGDTLLQEINPWNKAHVPVNVSIGNHINSLTPVAKGITLKFYNDSRNYIIGILIIIFLVFSIWIISKNKFQILRNHTNNQQNTEEKVPFSLARTQMAFWTIVVLIAFFAIWAKTGGIIEITTQLLVLLGISSATKVTGNLIDAGEISDDTIKRYQETNSQGLFVDIISDSQGLSVHRFQNVVFTLAIGCYFLFKVFHAAKIPNLDDNLMVLMGISSGTYLAVKHGENKGSKKKSPPPPPQT